MSIGLNHEEYEEDIQEAYAAGIAEGERRQREKDAGIVDSYWKGNKTYHDGTCRTIAKAIREGA